MGLPLYNPPVESDILTRKAAISERRPAVARSRIRGFNHQNAARSRRTDSEGNRQRLLGIALERESSLGREERAIRAGRQYPIATPVFLPNVLRDESNNAQTGESAVAQAPAVPRRQRDSDVVIEELMQLQAGILASAESDPITSVIRVPSDCPYEAPLSAIRYFVGQSEGERRLAIAEFAAQPFVRRNRRVLRMIASDFEGHLLRFVEPASAREDAQEFLEEVGNFVVRLDRSEYLSSQATIDGLGDRDRSVSPDGYDVWETLLTTVTPDPQPPSIGSSFTSASASMVASQGAATVSSATSFTNPDTVEERVGHEPGCESDGDTDSDNDDTAGGLLPFTSQQLEILARNTGAEADRLETSAAQVRAAARRIPRSERARILEAMGGAHRSIQATVRRHDDAVHRHNEVVRQQSISARNLANIRRRLAAARARDRQLASQESGQDAEDGGQAGEAGETGPNPNDSPGTGTGTQQDPVPATEPAAPALQSASNTVGVGGTGGLQNIIRALAERQDIPNSWWAEAGLSRNIPGYDTSE